MVVNPRFEIPPGDPSYRVDAERMLEQDEEVLELMPHTHVRGIGFKYEAVYPDGKKEVLLDVPHYDFNWQNSYVLAEPKLLPKGTTLHCEAFYNNSTSNLANPDPTQTVRWGEQTWEEMMIGYYDRALAGEDRSKHPVSAAEARAPGLCRSLTRSWSSWPAGPGIANRLRRVCQGCARETAAARSRVRDERGRQQLRGAALGLPGKKVTHFAETGFKAPSRMVPLSRFSMFNRVISLPDLNALGFVAAVENDHCRAQVERPCAGFRGWPAEQRQFLECLGESVSSGEAWRCSRVWPRRLFPKK